MTNDKLPSSQMDAIPAALPTVSGRVELFSTINVHGYLDPIFGFRERSECRTKSEKIAA